MLRSVTKPCRFCHLFFHLFWPHKTKVTSTQLIPIINKFHFPFSHWWPVLCCFSKFLSHTSPLTYFCAALMVWAMCHDFHSFYKHIKDTLKPPLKICLCVQPWHTGISMQMNTHNFSASQFNYPVHSLHVPRYTLRRFVEQSFRKLHTNEWSH